jgi:hypothetical protein
MSLQGGDILSYGASGYVIFRTGDESVKIAMVAVEWRP